jgi:OHCU decarboxylase
MKLDALNQTDDQHFLAEIGGPLEGQHWLAQRVAAARPFVSVEALFAAFEQVVAQASIDERIALIASHPDLAGKAAIAGEVSADSKREQAAAGLDRLTPEEYAAFHEMNSAYKAKFGFPFVICARENTKDSILAAYRTRIDQPRQVEIELAVGEVLKILRLRLLDRFS